MLGPVCGIKEGTAKGTCTNYKLGHRWDPPAAHILSLVTVYTCKILWRQWRKCRVMIIVVTFVTSWVVGALHLLPPHVSTVQCRTSMIFKSHADSSQPWDLAARTSTWVIFSLPLSMSHFIFTRQDFILSKGTRRKFELGSTREEKESEASERRRILQRLPSEEIRSSY